MARSRRQLTDLEILKKARRKVLLVIAGTILLIMAGFIGGSCLLSLNLLPHPLLLEQAYMISGLIQMFCLIGLFILFMTGEKWCRTVYWTFFGLECLTFLLPVWVYLQDYTDLISCSVWILLILLKLYILYSLGRWLGSSKDARIYLDHVVQEVVSRDELEIRQAAARTARLQAQKRASASRQRNQQVSAANSKPVKSPQGALQRQNQRPAAAAQRKADLSQRSSAAAGSGTSHNTARVRASAMRTPDYSGGDHRVPVAEDKGAILYPQLAIRLGAVVLISLILFPAIVQIFQNLFVSTDNKQVFATGLMFTVCILSAIIWIIPVFFLYLKEPFSKTCVLFCLLLEIIAGIWFGFRLYSYAHLETVSYGWQVFLYLIVLDAIRLGILFWGIAPVFSTPRPLGDQDDQDQLLEEQLPDDLIIAEDDDFFEEVPEEPEEKNPDFLARAGSNIRTHLSDLSTRILLNDPGSPEEEEEKQKNKQNSSAPKK